MRRVRSCIQQMQASPILNVRAISANKENSQGISLMSHRIRYLKLSETLLTNACTGGRLHRPGKATRSAEEVKTIT